MYQPQAKDDHSLHVTHCDAHLCADGCMRRRSTATTARPRTPTPTLRVSRTAVRTRAPRLMRAVSFQARQCVPSQWSMTAGPLSPKQARRARGKSSHTLGSEHKCTPTTPRAGHNNGTTWPDWERTSSRATMPCVATIEGFSVKSMAATTSQSKIQDVKIWSVSAGIWKATASAVRKKV